MKDEAKAIYLHRRLTDDGYTIKPDGDRWSITEPPGRSYPQERRGLSTLDECAAWADGVETGRTMAVARKRRSTPEAAT